MSLKLPQNRPERGNKEDKIPLLETKTNTETMLLEARSLNNRRSQPTAINFYNSFESEASVAVRSQIPPKIEKYITKNWKSFQWLLSKDEVSAYGPPTHFKGNIADSDKNEILDLIAKIRFRRWLIVLFMVIQLAWDCFFQLSCFYFIRKDSEALGLFGPKNGGKGVEMGPGKGYLVKRIGFWLFVASTIVKN